MNIEIISGSYREDSLTQRLALHLRQAIQSRTGLDVGLIDVRDHQLEPVKQVIVSTDKAPDSLRELAERMFAADAFIVVSPEYNGASSPALQNLFDHFPKQSHKAFGIATGSPGALGGVRAALQLQHFTLALFGIPSPHMLITPNLDKKFDEEGNLRDEGFRKAIDNFVEEFIWLAERVSEKVTA